MGCGIGLMLLNMYSFIPMDASTAKEIADTWKYPLPHDFYDMTADPEDYDEFVDLAQWPTHFFKILEGDKLVGFFSLTTTGDAMEAALGMHPDLVGQGRGSEFLRSCLGHAREACGVSGPITLNVADFNVRAIRAYEKTGFRVTRRFRQTTNGAEFDFLEMKTP